MRLLMSSASPRNSTYTDEVGQVLYKVDKPVSLNELGTATIRKAVTTVNGVWLGDTTSITQLPSRDKSPFVEQSTSENWSEGANDDNSDRQSLDKTFENSDGEEEISKDSSTFEGHLAIYAQVEFNSWHSSCFLLDGRKISVSDYFRKGGWSSYGRDRIFKASDGKEYRWHLGGGVIDMARNDESKARVFEFKEYRREWGPFKGRPASLEIDDSCIPILDEIILTFIYCEKLRNDRTYYGTRRNSVPGVMGYKH